jgi:predicted small lipoprotein YifL
MHCWARSFFIVVVIALGTLSMIDACGQKGPLYLPEPGAEKPAPKPPAIQGEAAPTTGADVPTPTDRPAASPALKWP